MAGTPINNNNLPKGVTVDENSGLYIITNSKGQTSRVGAGTQEELNAYANSWKTGVPVTVTTTSPLDGSTSQQVYDPAKIQGQQQSIADYKSTGANTTNPSPSTAEVAASTNAVNTVTNTPSNLQPAPSDGSLNSPLVVDSTKVSAGQDPQQAQQAAIVNADNTAPAQVSTFTDPAQQRIENQNIVETIKYDGGVTTVSPFNDPAQRAQAQQDAIDAEAPAIISTFEDPAQRGAAFQEAIENPGPVSPSNIVDPAQRQQNEIIQSEFPATISNVQDPAQRAQALQTEIEFADSGPQTAANPMGLDPAQMAQGLTAKKLDTQSQATQQDVSNFKAKEDWRVRLSLAPGASYLYKANPAGILAPLQATDGVIFPYTPDISVSYNATYDPTELTHSNYKFFTYRGSAVDSITIGCEFTAQDTAEANYVLAVIHFFRSITKMFYGQDNGPVNGTPPPLCYLSGLGAFQFDAHPLAITNFTYKLPTDVDYIIAGSTATPAGVNRQNNPSQGKPGESVMAQAGASRMDTSGLNTGAIQAPPNWQTTNTGTKDATYVPTKINLSITAVPIITRNDISNKFSLKQYATGQLLRGTQRSGGGIW